MPKFKKEEKELSNHLESWLYYLKNLENLTEIPKIFEKDEILKNAFDVAEFLKLDKERKFAYQQDLKARLDYKNSMDYAKELAEQKGMEKGLEKGLEQGREKEKLEIAKNLLAMLDNAAIAKTTGLNIDDIEALR